MANNFKANTRPADNRTSASSSTSTSPTSTTVYLKHVRENKLDSIDLPTCLWSLYMISEDAFMNNKDINAIKLSGNTRKVLIASSGRTDEFTISNVNIESNIGRLPGVNTNFTFDITTPYQSDLIDKLLTSAALLGTNNYSKAPLFLELNIKGRDPKTGLSKHFATKNFAIFIRYQ